MSEPKPSSGLLDPDYGEKGVSHPHPDMLAITASVDAQPGRLITGIGSSERYFIAKVDDSGKLDKRFGTDGITWGHFPGDGYVRSIQTTADNRVFVIGSETRDYYNNLIVARFDENGQLDIGFGDNGYKLIELPIQRKRHDSATAEISHNPGHANQTHLLAADKIYIFDHFAKSSAVVRLDLDGNLDRSFSENGYKYLTPPGYEGSSNLAFSMTIRNNKIYVCGSIFSWDNLPFVACLNDNGTEDKGFNNTGYHVLTEQKNHSLRDIVALEKQQGIVCCGYSGLGYICGFKENGELDFIKYTDSKQVEARWQFVQTFNEHIITVGTARIGGETVDHDEIIVGRWNLDGSPDTSFGRYQQGWDHLALGLGNEYAYSADRETDGKTIITGNTGGGVILRCLTAVK
ncbi:conserved protein of unknown function [Pseudomonas sp. JV551A1]|uniref:Delta-60 repeat domain-containing protein n=1 Tax=Pseudomonas inefficax TaxID=2078786 RepID=A0AAQ1PDT3_9PSED|nr:hypothetical protein [Pseudomonas]SPO57280.1 conserved protein of unknown function [Pseudomonas sp. JV551A1]SPO63456.1 conserved protein of unknown function [Pseudomonas inefficax]